MVKAKKTTKAKARKRTTRAASPTAVLDAGAVAAEMLVHFGRGQMAAENGVTHAATDVGVVSPKTDIFKRQLPTGAELVEKMFLVFAQSIAASNIKGHYNTDTSLRRRANGYAFLLGNLAWQNLNGGTKIELANLNAQLVALQARCTTTAAAGGGEFCHRGPF